MEVSANKSTEEVQGGFKVYTGLSNFKVVSINPSLERIRERINPNAKDTAADYTGKDKDGNPYVRIDFYLASSELSGFRGKIAFFLTAKEDVAKSGKARFIDKKGNYTYAESIESIAENPNMKWMDAESLRPALVGEPLLIDFFKAWLNVNTRKEDSKLRLTDPMKMAKTGDLTEIKEIYKLFITNEVKLLAVARVTDDGKIYQDFYKGHFSVPYEKKFTRWIEALEDTYTGLKSGYRLQDGLKLTEYVGDPTIAVTQGSESAGAPAPASGGYNDAPEDVF